MKHIVDGIRAFSSGPNGAFELFWNAASIDRNPSRNSACCIPCTRISIPSESTDDLISITACSNASSEVEIRSCKYHPLTESDFCMYTFGQRAIKVLSQKLWGSSVLKLQQGAMLMKTKIKKRRFGDMTDR